MEENISLKGVRKLLCSALSAASSSSVGGISGVLMTDQATDTMEQIAPTKN